MTFCLRSAIGSRSSSRNPVQGSKEEVEKKPKEEEKRSKEDAEKRNGSDWDQVHTDSTPGSLESPEQDEPKVGGSAEDCLLYYWRLEVRGGEGG